jgi:hypothetical protein
MEPAQRRRFGHRRLGVLMAQRGWLMNHNKFDGDVDADALRLVLDVLSRR